MTPDEIIRALRENADWCGANEYEIPLCMGDNQREAADLIESLQANLASKTMELSDLREAIRIKGGTEHAPTEYAFFTACAVVRKLHAQLSEKTALLDATIAGQETLQRALAASQRREQAAVEQIEQKMIFDAGTGREPCEICANAEKKPCIYCKPKWRGPQEAGEERRNEQI